MYNYQPENISGVKTKQHTDWKNALYIDEFPLNLSSVPLQYLVHLGGLGLDGALPDSETSDEAVDLKHLRGIHFRHTQQHCYLSHFRNSPKNQSKKLMKKMTWWCPARRGDLEWGNRSEGLTKNTFETHTKIFFKESAISLFVATHSICLSTSPNSINIT